MTKKIQVAIAGANGRMGRELLLSCSKAVALELSAALVRVNSPWLGQNIDQLIAVAQTDISCTEQDKVFDDDSHHNIDVLIDFTLPDNTVANLQRCVKANIAMLIGTTGFNSVQQRIIDKASTKIAIVQASNMSIGINLVLSVLRNVTQVLGDSAHIEISESHHIHKQDSPSGTAISMGEVIAKSLDKNLQDCMEIDDLRILPARSGIIKFSSIRKGEIIGDHGVSFILDGEIIEIKHKATSRQIYANGAMNAAKWIGGKQPGLYSMNDVLGL